MTARPNFTSHRCGFERRSRCSLPTSNAFSASEGSDYVDHAEQMTNFSSQQPPKTSVNSLRSFLLCSKRAEPDKKGTRALKLTPFWHQQNVVFPQNGRKPDFRCKCEIERAARRKRTIGAAPQFLRCANAAKVGSEPNLTNAAPRFKGRFGVTRQSI